VKLQKLMRTWYKTDAEPGTYDGAFSDPFPGETPDRKIIAVDWSTVGEVEVTWLVSAP
jgi:hypothetical protein